MRGSIPSRVAFHIRHAGLALDEFGYYDHRATYGQIFNCELIDSNVQKVSVIMSTAYSENILMNKKAFR